MPTESESQVGRDVRLTLIDREKGREGAGRGEKSEPRSACLVIMSDDDQRKRMRRPRKGFSVLSPTVFWDYCVLCPEIYAVTWILAPSVPRECFCVSECLS